MIRLFVYTMVRIIIVALAVFFGIAIFRWIIRKLQGHSFPSAYPKEEGRSRPKEDYRDVKDASFTDVSNKEGKSGQIQE